MKKCVCVPDLESRVREREKEIELNRIMCKHAKGNLKRHCMPIDVGEVSTWNLLMFWSYKVPLEVRMPIALRYLECIYEVIIYFMFD